MSSRKTRKKKVASGKSKAGRRIKPAKEPKRPLENFDVDLGSGRVQIPAMLELENMTSLLEAGDDPIGEGKVDIDRFIEILDPENWVSIFTPTTVREYRDINGCALTGDDYEHQMETVFKRFLNPVALAFGRYAKSIPCELLRKGEWAKMYEVLASWPKYQHWFFYACDPLESAKVIRQKPEVSKPRPLEDPTTLN